MSRYESPRKPEATEGVDEAVETNVRPPLEERLIPEEEINELDNAGKAFAHVHNIREVVIEAGRLPARLDNDQHDLLPGRDNGIRYMGYKVDYDAPQNELTGESAFVLRTESAGYGRYGQLTPDIWPKNEARGIFTIIEEEFRDGRVKTTMDYNGNEINQMAEDYRGRVFTDGAVEKIRELYDELLRSLPEPDELEE